MLSYVSDVLPETVFPMLYRSMSHGTILLLRSPRLLKFPTILDEADQFEVDMFHVAPNDLIPRDLRLTEIAAVFEETQG